MQEYIGEAKVNEALRNFLKAYAYKDVPYPTTADFLAFLEPQIPPNLQYVVTDWFKKVTLYDYSVTEATYTAKPNGSYIVDLTVEAKKFTVDASGESKEIPQNDWVEIGVYVATKEKELLFVKRVFITEKQMNFTFEVDKIPAKVAIDPKRLLIERVIDDNVKVVIEAKS